jgi:hypothetical protein
MVVDQRRDDMTTHTWATLLRILLGSASHQFEKQNQPPPEAQVQAEAQASLLESDSRSYAGGSIESTGFYHDSDSEPSMSTTGHRRKFSKPHSPHYGSALSAEDMRGALPTGLGGHAKSRSAFGGTLTRTTSMAGGRSMTSRPRTTIAGGAHKLNNSMQLNSMGLGLGMGIPQAPTRNIHSASSSNSSRKKKEIDALIASFMAPVQVAEQVFPMLSWVVLDFYICFAAKLGKTIYNVDAKKQAEDAAVLAAEDAVATDTQGQKLLTDFQRTKIKEDARALSFDTDVMVDLWEILLDHSNTWMSDIAWVKHWDTGITALTKSLVHVMYSKRSFATDDNDTPDVEVMKKDVGDPMMLSPAMRSAHRKLEAGILSKAEFDQICKTCNTHESMQMVSARETRWTCR